MLIRRRQFLQNASAATSICMGAASGLAATTTSGAFAVGNLDDSKVAIELPRLRVPLSFIIDDSTCLVNMGKYCMPQFANTYPDRDEYKRPWRDWPHEIPDSFVRNFGVHPGFLWV